MKLKLKHSIGIITFTIGNVLEYIKIFYILIA